MEMIQYFAITANIILIQSRKSKMITAQKEKDERMKTPEIDGVWRSKESGKLLKIRSSSYVKMIDGDTDKPYDAYKGFITLEGKDEIPKCLIEVELLHNSYDKVF